MNPNGSASRGELTKAMGATIQTVRKHEMQIAAMLEGIKQLMDGQAALGEEFKALKQRVDRESLASEACACSVDTRCLIHQDIFGSGGTN